jgi:hypothetical protein
MVCGIARGIEHTTGGPVFGHTLTPQIGQMSTQWSSVYAVPYNPRLYNHATRAIGQV